MKTPDLGDLDASSPSSSWNFDSATALFSNPPSPLLLSPSLPPPANLLWIFEDRPDEIVGNFDSAKEDHNLQNEKIRSFPMLTFKEVSNISYMIKERMMQALRYFKEWTSQRVLVQVWVPIKNGDRYVLTTSEQPFVLDPNTNGLLHYRNVSSMYLFSFDEDNDDALGLPGRVFKLKLPEWTPNVQYYSSKEYPRLSYALLYNVRGSLALPIFEPIGRSCVGVVELITTSEMVNYAPEVDKVCRALEAVNLSSKILDHQITQTCNEGHQAALTEILEILTVICESQKLPLAQTWVPLQHCTVHAQLDGSRKISTSNGSSMAQVCLSISDAAFYVVDTHMLGFRDACSEHHLQNGQGVVGRAFAVQHPCFCSDITKFCKTEYPLAHYAMMFGLVSCFALCLGSSHSDDDVYVAEFFLPPDCKDPVRQHTLLESISSLVKQSSRCLKVITGAELEGMSFEKIDMISYKNHEMKHIQYVLPKINTLEGPDEDENRRDADHNSPEQDLEICIDSENNTTPENGSLPASANNINKVAGRKRGKAVRTINLEVLQKYFSGSLKNAAKSLGVCPTTMKRICRHHGISRWPSRKINKVNRSISHLKQVIESVQVADVPLNLNSLIFPLPIAPARDSVAKDEGYFKSFKLPSEKSVADHVHTSSSSKTSSSIPEQNDANLVHKRCEIQQPFSANTKQFTTLINPSEVQNPASQSSPTEADLLIEDSASSRSVRNHPSSSTTIPKPKTVVVKARYRDDIIRFRVAANAGIVALYEEIGKRLMLVAGTFDIKYLDDDHDWVKLSYNDDLEECLEISATSGSSVIRLAVQDICTRHMNLKCIG